MEVGGKSAARQSFGGGRWLAEVGGDDMEMMVMMVREGNWGWMFFGENWIAY